METPTKPPCHNNHQLDTYTLPPGHQNPSVGQFHGSSRPQKPFQLETLHVASGSQKKINWNPHITFGPKKAFNWEPSHHFRTKHGFNWNSSRQLNCKPVSYLPVTTSRQLDTFTFSPGHKKAFNRKPQCYLRAKKRLQLEPSRYLQGTKSLQLETYTLVYLRVNNNLSQLNPSTLQQQAFN